MNRAVYPVFAAAARLSRSLRSRRAVNLYPDQRRDNKEAASSRVFTADDFRLDLLSIRLMRYLRTLQLSGAFSGKSDMIMSSFSRRLTPAAVLNI